MTAQRWIHSLLQRCGQAPSASPSAAPRPAIGRVLVIEDDTDTRNAVADALREHDFDVICAQDGFLALRLAQMGRPDLIVLDLGLPLLDGTTFLAHMRKSTWIPAVPVIVVSARPNAELAIRRAGAAAFLAKPLDLGTLVGVARTLLHRRPPAAGVA